MPSLQFQNGSPCMEAGKNVAITLCRKCGPLFWPYARWLQTIGRFADISTRVPAQASVYQQIQG